MNLPVRFSIPLQPLAVLILISSACSTVPEADLNAWIPEGFYHFECEIVHQDNLARIRHLKGNIRVDLLGDLKGGFSLRPLPGGALEIYASRMDYPGLKRSFKGEGRVIQPGVAEGDAISWLKSIGPFSRDHREGAWSLRPATPQEIERYQDKQQRLREYQRRVEES